MPVLLKHLENHGNRAVQSKSQMFIERDQLKGQAQKQLIAASYNLKERKSKRKLKFVCQYHSNSETKSIWNPKREPKIEFLEKTLEISFQIADTFIA